MKTKKSKIVALILLATMVFTLNLLSINIYANETTLNGCSHNYVVTSTEVYHYTDFGPVGHGDLIKTTHVCTKCDDFYFIFTPENVKKHIIIVGEDWHSGSNHYLVRPCSMCSYSTTESWTCSGNPCITPQRINLIK